MNHLIYVFIYFLLMLPALGLILFPIFPAFTWVWVLALIYGIFDGFNTLTVVGFSILTFLYLLSYLVDFLSGFIGSKITGASKKAFIGGLIGSLVGLTLLPPFGALPGIFLGVLITELIYYKDMVASIRSAYGALMGTLAGLVINFILMFTFVTLFLIFAWK
jgi:uncharacterized protein